MDIIKELEKLPVEPEYKPRLCTTCRTTELKYYQKFECKKCQQLREVGDTSR